MLTAGSELRALRVKLGLTMRNVERASERLGRKHGNEEYFVPISRLSDFETKNVIPSIYRIYSLAVIYRRDFRELTSLYGVTFDSGQHTRPIRATNPGVDPDFCEIAKSNEGKQRPSRSRLLLARPTPAEKAS
jgi:transcriptional regulator with XRE-family HTH domain